MRLVVVAACIQLLIPEVTTLVTDDPDKDFMPPLWPKIKHILNDADNSIPINLENTSDSGCSCLTVPTKWFLCYGQESCKAVPQNIIVDTPLFRIKTTQIKQFSKGDFFNMSQLITLEIEANLYLTQIEPHAFQNLTNLSNLTISYNLNLQNLEKDTFDGLINLQRLSLLKNGFSRIIDATRALSRHVLPNLMTLSLSENKFQVVTENDFSPMNGTSLKELNLVLCQIDYIHFRSLNPLKHLSTLRIGQNTLNTSTLVNLFQASIENGIYLKNLNLYDAGFRKAPPKLLLNAISKSNVTQLILTKNQFETIDTSTFPPMPKLEYLDLREVLALNISYRAFGGMPKLHTLLLGGNKLQSLPNGALLQQLTYLDLSRNSGNSFSPSYFSLGKHKFVKMENLKVLELSYNQIATILNHTFVGLKKLQVLGLRNASIFHIQEESFEPLEKLVFLNLENNWFGKSGLTSKIFKGLNNLEVLLLGGCSISNISNTSSPFVHFTSLTHLGLENNKILTLNVQVFTSLQQLSSIDLSQNLLIPWQERLFEINTNLTKLLLVHNKFSYMSMAMLEDLTNLTLLDISSNPFACECFGFKSIHTWIQKNDWKILDLLRKNPAFCIYPEKNSGITISQFSEMLVNGSQICDIIYKPSIILYYVLPLLILMLAFLSVSIVFYFYRSRIQYWMFVLHLNLNKLRKQSQIATTSCTNYLYDAFISYSNEDRCFVTRLVTMLENFEPYFKLCVYERDFEVGAIISETVLENLAKSRKTVLIISDSFVRSQWCRWELQIAQHHGIILENSEECVEDTLVMIKLGEVSDAHVTPTLKYLMKTRIYLQWDAEASCQRIFWNKLRKALTPSKAIFDSSV